MESIHLYTGLRNDALDFFKIVDMYKWRHILYNIFTKLYLCSCRSPVSCSAAVSNFGRQLF